MLGSCFEVTDLKQDLENKLLNVKVVNPKESELINFRLFI